MHRAVSMFRDGTEAFLARMVCGTGGFALVLFILLFGVSARGTVAQTTVGPLNQSEPKQRFDPKDIDKDWPALPFRQRKTLPWDHANRTRVRWYNPPTGSPPLVVLD